MTRYTDADIELAHDAFARAWTGHELVHPIPEQCASDEPQEDCCDRVGLRAALDALAAAEPAAHPWQEYNAHGNTCHFPGCRLTEDEHHALAALRTPAEG